MEKWEGHLAVIKLGLRKDHGLQRKISFWSLIFKNMVQGIGDQFLVIQVKQLTFSSFGVSSFWANYLVSYNFLLFAKVELKD